MASPGLAEDAL